MKTYRRLVFLSEERFGALPHPTIQPLRSCHGGVSTLVIASGDC